eukprot:TRINITY_DN40501_c0_g1_i1.p1 TRINITY_DN40501_c0_g1~~TRINITY_DN40501_c0_g1_i1.p1  ORF type:complete len:771 (-),score=130.14 TRINITY_DN40501_c0_g1_i1:105-2417(-)
MTSWLKVFSGGGTKELQYNIHEEIQLSDEYKYRHLWTLHRGTSKNDGSEATVFVYQITPQSPISVIELCRNCLKKSKTMMLPSVLKFLDGLETPTAIYLVTEPVLPLHTYLIQHEQPGEDVRSQEFVSWGLYSIIKGLVHLHSRNTIHGNLGVHSVYVTKSGDWKLFDLGWTSRLGPPEPGQEPQLCHFKLYHELIPNELKSPELLKVNFGIIESAPVYSCDAWALGLMIYEIFNSQITGATSPSDLKNPGRTPRPLFFAFMGLVSHTATMRMNPAKLIDYDDGNEYFQNEYIGIQEQLEQMALILKDAVQMDRFFRQLEVLIPTFPKANCKYKILPKIAEATQFGSGGTAALTTILKLGELLTTDEYQQLVIPGLMALFAMEESTVRIRLLQSVQLYVHQFPEERLAAIWVHVAKGFVSKVAEIRELSVKALVHFVPHLPERIIANDVLKAIWALQTDPEGGIRTNTAICLAKLAPSLTQAVREKMFIACFTRALKDTFHHARMAACSSFAATVDYYSPPQLATVVLPAVAPLTVDPVKEVRVTAFQCITAIMRKLQRASDGIVDPIPETVKPTPGKEVPTSGLLNWATSSIRSKIYGETSSPTPAAKESTPTSGFKHEEAAHKSVSRPETSHQPAKEVYGHEQQHYSHEYAAEQSYGAYGEYNEAEQWNEGGGGGDGWGEEEPWDEEEQQPVPVKAAPKAEEPISKGGGWDTNDDWDSDEGEKKITQPPTPPPQPQKPAKSPPEGTMSLAAKKPVKKSLGAVKKVATD